jgi:hypothetical protein
MWEGALSLWDDLNRVKAWLVAGSPQQEIEYTSLQFRCSNYTEVFYT